VMSAFGATTSAFGAQQQAPLPDVKSDLPPVGQISTLPVLGEDSDARKKRFESSLPDNRYLEVR
jgi:hypothetical protein